jgi:hypothetical protein
MKHRYFLKNLLSRDRAVLWLLTLTGILVYATALPNEMFWDDFDFILNNAYIKDWQFWPNFFTQSVITGAGLISNYWRPLLLFILSLEWHLWADWVWGWHAVSILAHIACSGAVFFALKRILPDRRAALLTAFMFLIHPANTEAVVYPNSLGDSLATFFIFTGIIFYARARDKGTLWPGYALSLGAYILAILSKESGILLVGFLALADYFFLTPEGPFFPKAGRVLKRLWPFILIAIGYVALRATVLNFSNSFNFYNESNEFTSNFFLRFTNFLRVLSLYAGFLFTPYDLRVERLLPYPATFLKPDILWGLALFTGLWTAAFFYRLRKPLVTFGVLWFFLAVFPTSNLVVIINAPVYEHWLYAAMIGVWAVVFTLGLELNGKKRKIFLALTIVLLGLFAVRTAWRNTDWRTAIGFYEKLLPTCPTSYRVMNNLGMAYADKGFLDKAEATYKKAILIMPGNAVAYHNLANIYRDRKETDEAIRYYKKALSLQENFLFSYRSLIKLYMAKNDIPQARALLEKYFILSNDKPFATGLLVQLAMQQKDYAGARNYLETALQLSPGDPDILKALEEVSMASQKQ